MNAAKLPTSTVFKSAATLLDATSRRSFANMTKGMGREGGGRGPGGPHRTPKNVGGIAGRGGASGDGGGGAFAELRARRNAMNLERDLEAARKATESAAGSVGGGGADRGGAGRGAGIGGFGGRGGRGDGGRGGGRGGRLPHTRNHPPRQYPHQHPSGGTDGNPPSHRVAHRGGPPKANFAETVLRPAAEGGDNPSNGSNDDNGNANANAGGPPPYSSGIPKLSARKHKGHAVHDAEQLMSAAPKGYRRSGRASVRGEMRGVVLGDLEKESAAGAGGGATDNNNNNATSGYGGDRRFARDSPMHNRQRAIGLKSNHPSSTPDMEWEQQMSKMMIVSNNGLINDNDTDGYDSDDDLDPIISPDDDDYMDMNNHELIEKRGTDYIVHMDLGGDEEESRDNNRRGGNRSQQQPPTEIPGEYDPMTDSIEYQYLFRDITDIDNELLLRPSKPKSDAVLPLRAHGDELDDFLEATMDHPSKYAVIERSVKHADSKREARPTFPRNRKLPSEEFVNRFKGYLFVDGLVHPQLSKKGEKEEVWEWEDPLHQQSMKEVVAKIFGVTSLDVWPATATSAFVGFATKMEAKGAMIKSVENSSVVHPTALVAFDGLEEEGDGVTDVQKEFVAASSGGTGSILKVTGLPVGITSVEVLQAMFPRGSKLESMFGPLTKDDYLLLSPTTALVRLASSDLVSKALKSSNIAKNVSLIGKRNLQVLRAKRERVFDGWTGPNRAHAKSKLGNRLLVHGDVPPEDLFLSHNDVMHISGLPPTVTLNDLATFFQPFCADRRDILGSGHIVRCSQGVPTGSAYIGFELPGEMDQVKELYNGQATIGGADVRLRLVRDKMLRRGVREGARPARSLQELDLDLSDWERHVDPKDVEELETLGIDKSILNEIMITLRHHNRTFGAVDQAIPGERLYKERQVGMHYRDVVRKYVKVLKECTGTKDNPGLMYEAMFSPDQDVDMGLLDFEEKRIADLRTRGI